MEPRGQELIRRYKAYFNIPADAHIAEEKILAHWHMERDLRRELLESTPENRWDTFERCYSRLYAELDWLTPLAGRAGPAPSPARYRRWIDLIGSPPKSVYEIGSGEGELVSYLAEHGFICKGTEVTRERGQRHAADPPANLSWGVSDGIHLDRFEPSGSYDVVVSNHVIEHLHPGDLATHLSSARRLLKEGGRYVFCTPHGHTGPHDISRVVALDEPGGTHLKEYTYGELVEAAKAAGFSGVYYAFLPGAVRRSLIALKAGRLARPDRFGAWYLRWLLFVEKALSALPRGPSRRRVAGVLRRLYVFADNICLVAEK